MNYINLTRKIIPEISAIKADNIKAVNSIPEIVLNRMIQSGDKSILHVGMNQCAAARVSKNGITTVYTDGLAGCNALGLVAKGADGNPVIFLSHYTPLQKSQERQISAMQEQLDKFFYWLDKNTKPKTFMNLRDNEPNNPIIKRFRDLLAKYFPKGTDEKIEFYQTANRPAFSSSANIFQFNPQNTDKFKVTFVGEQEHFSSLC